MPYAACQRLATVLVGPAGSGKTATLASLAALWTRQVTSARLGHEGPPERSRKAPRRAPHACDLRLSRWSYIDGLRTTVPHVPVLHGSGSLNLVKHQAEHRRRSATISPSRQGLYDALDVLNADEASAVFTTAQVVATSASLGQPWSRATVTELIEDKLASATGRLERVRRGLYRLRTQGCSVEGADSGPVDVAGRVLEAVQALAAAGSRRVTSAEVGAELGRAGMAYSGRSVLVGLLALRRAQPPVLRRSPDGRYQLE